MSGAWIGGAVRAQLLVGERCLGADGAREIADSASLREALGKLGHSPYRRVVDLDLTLVEAQHAIASKALVDLRTLAGWLPGDALGLLRTLAAWFELANLEDRIAYFGGAPLRRPFELGTLAVVWPRASATQTPTELRAALATSSWGDVGGETSAVLGLGLRLAWARRVETEAPEVAPLAAGAAALLVARELFVVGLPVELLPVPALRSLGLGWQTAATFPRFVEELPPDAAWAFADVAGPADLWHAEARWWSRCELDARKLLHAALGDRGVVIGATALLAADARRVAAALEASARRGLPGVEEAFDAAA